MAYEYAISAGPGTLASYGAVETLDDAKWEYYDAENAVWEYQQRPDMAFIIAPTADAHDCETGR